MRPTAGPTEAAARSVPPNYVLQIDEACSLAPLGSVPRG
jgi:hypothetical protein